MNLTKTPTPGVMELANVDYGCSQEAYNKAMTPAALKACNIVVASLTVHQKDGIDCLLKNGFAQVGKPKKNPNSGNMILLFVKFIHNG